MVNYELLHTGSDCTGPYRVTFSKPMTVGKFIEEVLDTFSTEWGFIDVIPQKIFDGAKAYHLEYKYGQIIFSNVNSDVLTKEIKDVKGSGGWTRSDYHVYI